MDKWSELLRYVRISDHTIHQRVKFFEFVKTGHLMPKKIQEPLIDISDLFKKKSR